MSTKRNL